MQNRLQASLVLPHPGRCEIWGRITLATSIHSLHATIPSKTYLRLYRDTIHQQRYILVVRSHQQNFKIAFRTRSEMIGEPRVRPSRRITLRLAHQRRQERSKSRNTNRPRWASLLYQPGAGRLHSSLMLIQKRCPSTLGWTTGLTRLRFSRCTRTKRRTMTICTCPCGTMIRSSSRSSRIGSQGRILSIPLA